MDDSTAQMQKEAKRRAAIYRRFVEEGILSKLDGYQQKRLTVDVRRRIDENVYNLYYCGLAKSTEVEPIAQLLYPDPQHPFNIEFHLFCRARAGAPAPLAETPLDLLPLEKMRNLVIAEDYIQIKDEQATYEKICSILTRDPPTATGCAPAATLESRLASILASSPFAIVYGEAGTGKTTYITAVIEASLREQDSTSVVVVAPTNLAAENVRDRLGYTSTSVQISTIDLFVARPTLCDPPCLNLFIVDETSMLDSGKCLEMLETITRAQVHWRILFIGDHRQLRPIATSPIFRRLIDRFPAQCIHLDKVHRSGDSIVANARWLWQHAPEELTITLDAMLRGMKQSDNFRFVDSFSAVTDEELRAALIITYSNSDVARLSLGLHDRINPIEEEVWRGGVTWKVGDRVLCTINDRRRNIYRNSPCIITEIAKNSVTVSYKGRNLRLNWNEIMPGHVITIHRAQGQEADRVIIYLAPAESYEKDLIYTAITRAKKEVIIVYSPAEHH